MRQGYGPYATTRSCAHTGNGVVRECRLEPWVDLAGEAPDPAHGLVVLEESGLAHDQQVPEAADVIVHALDLSKDLIGCPGEHEAGLDRLLDRGVGAVLRVLVDRGTAQDLRCDLGRHITGRIAEVMRHLVRGDVPQQLLGAGVRLRLAGAGIDQRRIGEPVDGNVGAAAGGAPALAIGFVDGGRAAKTGEEGRLHVAARPDPLGTPRRRG